MLSFSIIKNSDYFVIIKVSLRYFKVCLFVYVIDLIYTGQ